MPFRDKFALRDAIAFLSSIELPKNKKQSTAVAASLVNETVISIKASAPVTESHAKDIVTSSVTSAHLLEAFENLTSDKKLIVINSALLASEKDIVAIRTKHLHAKEMVILHLKSFIIKTLTYCFVTLGVLTALIFLVLVLKNGAAIETSQATIFAGSFFSTLGEIIKVLLNDIPK